VNLSFVNSDRWVRSRLHVQHLSIVNARNFVSLLSDWSLNSRARLAYRLTAVFLAHSRPQPCFRGCAIRSTVDITAQRRAVILSAAAVSLLICAMADAHAAEANARKRVRLNPKEKKAVVHRYNEKKESYEVLAGIFKISKSAVFNIIRDKESITEKAVDNIASNRKTDQKCKFEVIDEILCRFVSL